MIYKLYYLHIIIQKAAQKGRLFPFVQSMTVCVRPMPTTALVSFFHVWHPQMPSAVRPIARWNPFTADSVFAPKMPSSVRVEYPSAFYPLY